MALKRQGLLCLSLAFLWQWWSGWARLGSLSAPAGDVGLCLALVLCRAGLSRGASLALWCLTLLFASMFSGVAPIWTFLVGWPAWIAVRALDQNPSRLSGASYLLYSTVLITLCRCSGKLFLMSLSGVSMGLTLSGVTVAGSLLSEAWPNLLFLLLFRCLIGEGKHK